MIRWSYVLPRLSFVVAVYLLLTFAVGPLLKWALIHTGETVLGSRLSIARMRASLWQSRVELNQVQLASPADAWRNLLECRSATFDLDSGELLRRRLVIHEGSIQGLVFGGERNESGKLGSADATDSSTRDRFQGNLATEWLSGVSDKLVHDFTENLESVRLARELKRRWPVEFEQLQAEADKWTDRVESIQQMVKQFDGNPPSNLGYYREGLQEIDGIREQLPELQNDFWQLNQQVQRDCGTIGKAKQRDVEYLRREFRLDRLDSDNFTEYLLGNEWSSRINFLAAWMSRGQKLLSSAGDASRLNPSRGQNICFNERERKPDLLFRSIDIDGWWRMNGIDFPFEGYLSGLTHQPKLHRQPVIMRLTTTLPTEIRIDGQLDYRGDTPVQKLVVNVPRLNQPQRLLGNPDPFGIRISPGTAHAWCGLDLVDDRLTGKILFRQDHVDLTPEISSGYATERFTRNLRQRLRKLDNIQAVIDVTGTINEPNWKLRSNLGPQVAGILEHVLKEELTCRRRQLEQQAENLVNKSILQLEQTIAAKQDKLMAELQLGEQLIARFERQIIARMGLPTRMLSTRPLQGLLAPN